MTDSIIEVEGLFHDLLQKVEDRRRRGLSRRAQHYRSRGWHDLAEVIETEEGKQVVRNGMQDILDWIK